MWRMCVPACVSAFAYRGDGSIWRGDGGGCDVCSECRYRLPGHRSTGRISRLCVSGVGIVLRENFHDL